MLAFGRTAVRVVGSRSNPAGCRGRFRQVALRTCSAVLPSFSLPSSSTTTTTTNACRHASVTKRTISSDFKEALLREKDSVATPTSVDLQDKAEEVLEEIQEYYELDSREQALTVITLLFHQGGTAKKAEDKLSVSIFGKDFTLGGIRRCVRDAFFTRGERRLARCFADEIHEIAVVLEVPGNLYRKIQKQDLERTFTMEEKAWLSDFQEKNENCPVELRKLILNSFLHPRN